MSRGLAFLSGVVSLSTKKWPVYIILILTGLLSLYLRVPYMQAGILNIDESIYSEVANTILDGKVLYKGAVDNKPPGIFYLYAGIFSLSGKNNLVAIHAAAAVCIIITGFLLYLVVSSIEGTFAGLLSGVLYMILPDLSHLCIDFQAANTEFFMMVPLMLSIVLFIKSENKLKKYLFLSGVFCACAALFKQQGAFFLGLLLLLAMFVPFPRSKTDVINHAFYSLCIIAGFLLPLGAVGIYFWNHSALSDLIYYVFSFNVIFLHKIPLIDGLRFGFIATLQVIGKNAGIYACACAQEILYICSVFQKKYRDSKMNKPFFWISWTVFSLISIASGNHFFGHYYIMVFPVIAGLCGIFWSKCILTLIHSQHKKQGILLSGICFLMFASFLIYPLWSYTGFPPGRTVRSLVDPFDTDSVMPAVIDYIKQKTTPSDSIFVWGFYPQLYLLADRRCGSRFVHCNFLVGDIPPYKPDDFATQINTAQWDRLIEDFDRNNPKYIIDTAPYNYFGFGGYRIEKFPVLSALLMRDYVLESRIGKVCLYRHK